MTRAPPPIVSHLDDRPVEELGFGYDTHRYIFGDLTSEEVELVLAQLPQTLGASVDAAIDLAQSSFDPLQPFDDAPGATIAGWKEEAFVSGSEQQFFGEEAFFEVADWLVRPSEGDLFVP